MGFEWGCVLIEYYGHSCFALTSGATKVVIDPYGPEVGYKLPNRGATMTLVSHEHFDHNHVEAVVGRTSVVRGAAGRSEAGVTVQGVMADHDGAGGSLHGKVTIFCLDMEGLRLVHLSDLGHPLNAELLREIGKVDVLFVPTGGGGYTLGPAEALKAMQALKPTLTIPMHYRTPFLNRSLFPDLEPVEPFLRLSGGVRGDATLKVELGAPRVLAMTHLF